MIHEEIEKNVLAYNVQPPPKKKTKQKNPRL